MNVMIRQEEEKDYERVYEIHFLACKQENESKLIEKIRLGDELPIEWFPQQAKLIEEKGDYFLYWEGLEKRVIKMRYR